MQACLPSSPGRRSSLFSRWSRTLLLSRLAGRKEVPRHGRPRPTRTRKAESGTRELARRSAPPAAWQKPEQGTALNRSELGHSHAHQIQKCLVTHWRQSLQETFKMSDCHVQFKSNKESYSICSKSRKRIEGNSHNILNLHFCNGG